MAEEIAGQFCPLCGGRGAPAGSKHGYPLRECCGILLSWPWESEGEYESWYAGGAYHHAHQVARGAPPFLARDQEALLAAACRLALLRAHYPHHRSLLDVGCGTGALVALAGEMGYRAEGIEPGQALVAYAGRLGRRVRAGTWGEARGGWEAITLHDVWEHLTRPVACLRHLAGCLAPGGVIVVEIPEWGSPPAVWEGLAWRHVRPAEHLFLPGDGAAQRLFARAGLVVEALHRPLRGELGKIAYSLARAHR